MSCESFWSICRMFYIRQNTFSNLGMLPFGYQSDIMYIHLDWVSNIILGLSLCLSFQGFFDEVEDLKFALHQSRLLNQEYEKSLRRLCKQFGVPYPEPEKTFRQKLTQASHAKSSKNKRWSKCNPALIISFLYLCIEIYRFQHFFSDIA